MKRLARRLFDLVAVASLVLCLLLTGLWLLGKASSIPLKVIGSRGSDASVLDKLYLLEGGRVGFQHQVAVGRLAGRPMTKADSLQTAWQWNRLGLYCAKLEFRSGKAPNELVNSSIHFLIVHCLWGAAYAAVIPVWWLYRGGGKLSIQRRPESRLATPIEGWRLAII